MMQFSPIPSAACDSHVHVFDPARFPYATPRAYTPPAASVESLQEMHGALGVGRVVLVQPSVYGTDNACLLEAIARIGADRARGIAVVHPHRLGGEALDLMHEGGVRGIRLNLQVSGGSLDEVRDKVRSAKPLMNRPGWHLQVHASLAVVASVLDELERLDSPVVIDHYAGGLEPDPASGHHLVQLLAAMRRAPLWVKLSAPYRLWDGPGPAAMVSLARAFAETAPDRVLWGSDWPHTGGSGQRGGDANAIEPFREIDNEQVLQDLLAAMPDDAARRRLLVDNPARLYGFAT